MLNSLIPSNFFNILYPLKYLFKDEAAGKLQEDNSFETPIYKLRFTDASGYGSNSDIFTISNRYLLEEFIKFMKKKIQSKIEELEQLLISE